MPEYDNTNRGSVWKNDKKLTDKHPDLTGSLDVDGVEYWVSAWKRKEGANPKAPLLSFSVKRKDEVKKAAPKENDAVDIPNPGNAEAYFDDLPF
jgi:hypothetical protein